MGVRVSVSLPDTRARNHSLNSSTLRELLCELQNLHAGTLFARPRPPRDGGWTWSAVRIRRFLIPVFASSGLHSCAPQYQHRPPLFAQRYFRLSFGDVKLSSIPARLSLSLCFGSSALLPSQFIAHNVPFMFDNYAAPKECRVGYSKPTAVEAPLAEFHSEACYDVDLHRADLSWGRHAADRGL